MSTHNDGNTFKEVAAAHAEALRPLLVPGHLLSMFNEPIARNKLPVFPLPSAMCECGELMYTIAQFWDCERLWRAQFCFECSTGASLDSVISSPDMPQGALVQGNSHWIRTPSMFLPSASSTAWESNPQVGALLPVLGGADGEEEFHEALAIELGAALGHQAQSRLGGAPAFIQWEHEPVCPQCQTALRFVGQVSHDVDFHWADNGVAYLFACEQHPERTHMVCDTH